MNITSRSHWEDINTIRRFREHRSRARWRKWFSTPPARKFLYQICRRFFPIDPRLKVLEIGCAPGRRLLEFTRQYHYQPYGVEYTEAGAKATREEFRAAGIPEDHCFHSDVFDPGFQLKFKECFDVVVSFGFIEHFTDVIEVIQTHLHFLKPGGRLLIMIPNLRGIYYPLTKFFSPDLLPKHNLNLMKRNVFKASFRSPDLEPLFVGYYGLLNLGMLQDRGGAKAWLLQSLRWIQVFLNPLLRLGHSFENPVTSPYLLYIGKKK